MAQRDLAGRQRLHAAELQCCRQDAGVAGQHHGQPNDLRQRPAGGDEAVPPHQHDPPGGQYLGKISALIHVHDQQRGVAELFGNIPDRRFRSHQPSGMNDRLQRLLRDREGQYFFGMAVDDGAGVRVSFVGGAVDKAFQVRIAGVSAHRRAIQLELHDVGTLDQFRAARTGKKIPVRIIRMANADMAIGIDYVFIGEYPVRNDQVS